MKLTDLLDQIERLDQEATKGPWSATPKTYGIARVKNLEGLTIATNTSESITEFIALSRTALPQLAQALRAVVESCEETIRSVDKNLLPDERDHANRDHADMILDAITDAMEENNE